MLILLAYNKSPSKTVKEEQTLCDTMEMQGIFPFPNHRHSLLGNILQISSGYSRRLTPTHVKFNFSVLSVEAWKASKTSSL